METTALDNLTNSTLEAIFTRRAVRRFLPDMIDEDKLQKILAAGRTAPSAMNSQPWKFYVATHRDTISSFSKAIAKMIPKAALKTALKHPLRAIKALLDFSPSTIALTGEDVIFHGAPVVIFLTAPRDYEWGKLDIGMCAQNMMLAAQSLGIASCPVGFAKYIEKTPLYSKLDIPPQEEVLLAVILGYGNEKPLPHPKKGNNILFIDRMECC